MFKSINGGKLPTRASKYSAFVDLYANEDVVIDPGKTVKVGLGIKIDLELFFNNHPEFCTECINDPYSLNDLEGVEYSQFKAEQFIKTHYLQIELQSSLKAKGLIAETGVIDLDYEDEIKIILHNPIKDI